MYLMNYLLIIERKCRTQWIDALQKALKASSTFTKFSIWIATPLKNHDEISSLFRLRDSNLLFEVSYDAQMRCHAWSRPGQSQNLCHCRRGRRHHHYMLHLFMTSCNIKKKVKKVLWFLDFFFAATCTWFFCDHCILASTHYLMASSNGKNS